MPDPNSTQKPERKPPSSPVMGDNWGKKVSAAMKSLKPGEFAKIRKEAEAKRDKALGRA